MLPDSSDVVDDARMYVKAGRLVNEMLLPTRRTPRLQEADLAASETGDSLRLSPLLQTALSDRQLQPVIDYGCHSGLTELAPIAVSWVKGVAPVPSAFITQIFCMPLVLTASAPFRARAD